MTVRTTTLAFLALFFSYSAIPLVGRAPVPRSSPELKFTDTAGHDLLLSQSKGKVVLVEFLLTSCPHCGGLAQTVNRLNRELSHRGFQAIAIAFEDGPSGPTVADFARQFNLAFLTGYASSGNIDAYIGRAPTERFQVPQIVVIDRNGVIRAQSLPVGEKVLEDEAHLRSLIATLLDEGPRSWSSGVPALSLVLAVLLAGTMVWIRRRKWHRSLTSEQPLGR
jgi:peroxiredoxin